jgi:hypothetical protein
MIGGDYFMWKINSSLIRVSFNPTLTSHPLRSVVSENILKGFKSKFGMKQNISVLVKDASEVELFKYKI